MKYIYLPKAENKFWRIPLICRYITESAPDVLISYLSTPNIIACISKLINKRTKLIVSERNTNRVVGKNEKIRFSLYKFADYIVPNSYSQEQFIRNNFPNLTLKTRTITNFVDTDLFCPSTQTDEHNVPIIISVGRITHQKNIINYLKALKILVNKGQRFKAIWYGNTDNIKYQDKCLNLMNELQLNNFFEFRPATSDILTEYQKADLFCLPSTYEGFPNVVCEAMCCGLPIACGDVCDNSLIVEDGLNGLLFNPNDINDIAEKIERLLSHDKIIDMKVSNREKSINLFSSNTFLNKYLELFK